MEILEGILARDPSSTITIWHIGREDEKDHWWDLCAGPHVPTTGHIAPDAIDLETVAGGPSGAVVFVCIHAIRPTVSLRLSFFQEAQVDGGTEQSEPGSPPHACLPSSPGCKGWTRTWDPVPTGQQQDTSVQKQSCS